MFHGEWKRKVSTLIGWVQPEDGKKLKNHGKIFVYTSTTPPTMPAPNNQLELKSKTARDENRNTMTPSTGVCWTDHSGADGSTSGGVRWSRNSNKK